MLHLLERTILLLNYFSIMLDHKEVYLFNNYCSCVAMSHIFLMSTPNITFITLEIEIFVCVIPFNLSTLLLLICVIPFNLIILLLLNCHVTFLK
jgi:hypothetical protein